MSKTCSSARGSHALLGCSHYGEESGGYFFEVDDVDGSTERWAGSFAIIGPVVRESRVPEELLDH